MWVFEGDLGAYGTASGAFKSGISRIRGVYINFSQDPKTYICLMSVVELVIAPTFNRNCFPQPTLLEIRPRFTFFCFFAH